MGDIEKSIVAILSAIIGIAVLAVILSNGSNTVNVIKAFFGGVSGTLAVAISPITGKSAAPDTLQAGWSAGNTAMSSITSAPLTGVASNGAANLFGDVSSFADSIMQW